MLAPLATSNVQPMIFSVEKRVGGRGVRKTVRGYMDKTVLVLLQPLSSIEITKYFNCESRFNGLFSNNNLPRIKDGAYMINLGDKKSKRAHWVSLFIDRNTVV